MNRPTAEIERRQERRQSILFWALLGLVSYLLFFLFFGGMGLGHFFRMRTVRAQLTEELRLLQTENDRLRRKIERLTHDADGIEGLARDQLGLVREGEWVYEFYDP